MTTINDRLRIRFYASTSEGRTYGYGTWGALRYGDLTWAYGEEYYGDFDFGHWVELLMPNGEPLNCVITGLSMDLGRQRALDHNRIGTCVFQLVQMNVPNEWINEDFDSEQPLAVVLGRKIVVETNNNGSWTAAFTGTVEQATAQLQGTGNYDQPTMRWDIMAVDSLNKLRRIQEAPGTVWRAEEPVNARIDFIASRAELGTRYLDIVPAQECHPSEFETNLLDEAESVAKYAARLLSSPDGSYIDVETLHLQSVFAAPYLPSVVWIASPYEIWPPESSATGLLQRFILPCPVQAQVVWPMDRLINQVTVLTPDVPTDPTPEDYVLTDLASIADFGRRTYQDNLPMVETPGGPAITLATQILAAYKDPTPYVTVISLDFSLLLDVDTTAPEASPPDTPGTWEVGFAYAFRKLRNPQIISLTLPPTDAGRLPWGTNHIIGVSWRIDSVRAACDVFVEMVPDLYGTPENSIPEGEPTHPTMREGLAFGLLATPTTFPQISVPLPVTVDPLDVEVVLDWYDNGINFTNHFLACPAATGVPRAEAFLQTIIIGDLFSDYLRIQGMNATGTPVVSNGSVLYASALHRSRFYWQVNGSSTRCGLLNPGDTISGSFTTVSTAISGLWFAPGNVLKVGWEGPDMSDMTYGWFFGLQVKKLSTGAVLVDVRPQDWSAGSWVDPYGNVITVSSSVLYSNDLPAYLEE